MREDDLAPLFDLDMPQTFTVQEGVVQSWNTTTGSNLIAFGGFTFTDLPVAGPVTGIAAADRVLVLATATDAYVLGKITRP